MTLLWSDWPNIWSEPKKSKKSGKKDGNGKKKGGDGKKKDGKQVQEYHEKLKIDGVVRPSPTHLRPPSCPRA